MIYSQFYLKDKLKIPIPLAFLILLLITVFFIRVFHKSSLPSKATKQILRRVEITNIFPNQVTIFWQTERKSISWLLYGESPENLSSIILDKRDLAYKKDSYLNHYAIIKNLQPSKKYFFVFVIDNQLIKHPSGQPFSFSTPSKEIISKSSQLAYGKVLKPNGLPLENGVVFLNFPNSYSLFTITKSTGEWLIPLNFIYDKETLTYKVPSLEEKVKLEIISEDNLMTIVETKVSKLFPLQQTLIIGRNYNFLTEENVLSAKDEVVRPSLKKEIDIIYPQEGALIPGFTPIIKGLADPNTQVLINLFVGNKTYNSRVTSDKNGSWSLIFSEKLPLGKHKIVARTKNKRGEDLSIERNFLIVGNESSSAQVLGEATPEPTLTQYQRPTPTLTPTPSIILLTETISPTAPVSGGNNFFQILPLSISLIILGLGLFFVF